MIVVFLLIIQLVLALIHLFIGFLWQWLGVPLIAGIPWPWIFLVLSFLFTTASVLVHQGKMNVWIDRFYELAAMWLGWFHVIFWLTVTGALLSGVIHIVVPTISVSHPVLAVAGVIASLGIAMYARFQASTMQATAYEVALPALPLAWEGKKVIFASDIHVGAIWKRRQSQKFVQLMNTHEPEAVFFVGDVFDGPPTAYEQETEPFKEIQATHGAFFVNGNHERYSPNDPYLEALRAHGVRILMDEVVDLEGVQVIGVDYVSSTTVERMHETLAAIPFLTEKPSILLSHVPRFFTAPAERGISLQLSGHTHGGQLWPYTFLAKWVYKGFDRGLRVFGPLQVITSDGAGTWGPPMRLGTKSEIVVITLTSKVSS